MTPSFSPTTTTPPVITKHIGTGYADMTKHEWVTHQHRDSYALYMGQSSMMLYFSTSFNWSAERLRNHFTNKMVLPCNKPPKKEEEEEEGKARR